jgi:hypothetical protein
MVRVWGFASGTLLSELIFSLKLEKPPWAGGLHRITADFPLRTLTDRFDGGSGTVVKLAVQVSVL